MSVRAHVCTLPTHLCTHMHMDTDLLCLETYRAQVEPQRPFRELDWSLTLPHFTPVPGVGAERGADGSGASAGEQHPDASGSQPLRPASARQHHRPHHQGVAWKQDLGRLAGLQEEVPGR